MGRWKWGERGYRSSCPRSVILPGIHRLGGEKSQKKVSLTKSRFPEDRRVGGGEGKRKKIVGGREPVAPHGSKQGQVLHGGRKGRGCVGRGLKKSVSLPGKNYTEARTKMWSKQGETKTSQKDSG